MKNSPLRLRPVSRRSFVQAMLAAGVAPLVVPARLLQPRPFRGEWKLPVV